MNEAIEAKNENTKNEILGQPKKKRGRKPKNEKAVYELNTEQTKFFVDLSKDKERLDLVFKLLKKANKKDHGREVTFRELAMFGIEKLNQKDIEKIQDASLTKMEKVEKALDDYNKRHGTNLELGEFLVKKLSIN